MALHAPGAAALLLLPLALLAGHASAAGGPNAVLGLTADAWCEPQTCQPNAWLDFALEVDKQGTNANWLFEVEDLNADVEGYKTDALSLHLFPHAIPLDRATGLVATQAKNRLYTLEVSYYDIKEDTYFVGVRCGPVPTTFRVLARSVTAPLAENAPRDGEACDDQLIYHKFDAPANAAVGLVKVEASAKGADAAVHVMQHADTPPLRLSPPYTSVSPGESATVRVCWLVEGHAYYVALKTAAGCVPYTATLNFTNDADAVAACYDKKNNNTLGGGSHDIHHLLELEHNHFHYDVGLPLRYMDFRIHVGEADKDDNLVVFLEDLTSGPIDPRAFGLYLYTEGAVPVDRHTEHKSEYSVDGEYTVTINKWDLKMGEYVVSILTSDVSRSFRLVPYFIHSGIKPGGHVAGFVCPGQFVFHYIEVAGATDDAHRRAAAASPGTPAVAPTGPVDARFRFTVNTGDVNYLTRHLYPPLKLAPPYQHADSIDGYQNHTASICHAEPGRQYIGLSGGVHCAEYEMYADLIEPASPECTEITHLCTNECDIACTEMEVHHFEYSSCTPGEYRDFMLKVAEEDAMSNLIFQVDNLARNVRPEALGVYMYKDELPADRESQSKQEFSADGTWSVVVSEWDLKPAKYYLSVKCTGEEPVKFRVLAELSHSDLHNGEPVNGEVGPGSWAHYHYNVPTSATTPYRIVFQLKLFSGDVKLRTTVDHPPIKLYPPYYETHAPEHRADGPYAGHPMELVACATAGHVEFLGILGGSYFATFQVAVDARPVLDLGECEGMLHRRRLAAVPSPSEGMLLHSPVPVVVATSLATTIEPAHFMRASCQPHEWVDFVLRKDSNRHDCNVIFEVEDLSLGYTQQGLSVHVYKNAIPDDRISERRSTSTADGQYSVAINAWDFDATADYYVGVRCGDEPKSFRLLTEVVDGEVREGTHAVGYVCPGEFIYHFVNLDASSTNASDVHRRAGGAASGSGHGGVDISFELVLHTGGLTYKTTHGEPPLKLVPPYRTALAQGGDAQRRAAGESSTFVYLCGVEEGRHYLALLGKDHCADYELYAHILEPSSSCEEPVHEVSGARQTSNAEVMKLAHFTYASCETGEYKDFVFHVDVADASKNLRLEVATLDSNNVPDALAVHLYDGHIPSNRETEFSVYAATEGVWSFSVSKHDLHEGDYYLSVQCGELPVSFRVLPLLIESKMSENQAVHGVVCANDWVYHSFDVSAYIPGGAKHSEASEKMALEFTLDIHEGDFFFLVRPDNPPIRLSPPFRHATQHPEGKGHHLYTTSVCEVGHFDVPLYYLAVRGNKRCADYSISARVVDSCGTHEFKHEAGLVVGEVARPLREAHFVYDSCVAGEYVDFYFDVSETDAANNVVFDVEDLSKAIDSEALQVELHALKSFIPTPRDPTAVISTAAGRIYSMALDYTVLREGRYYVSVRCRSAMVRFRVSASLVKSKLDGVAKVTATVSPNEWTYHYRKVTDADATDGKPHLRWNVEIHSGDLYLAAERESFPPGFATKNHYQLLKTQKTKKIEVLVCNAKAEKHYLGVFGGSYKADYEVTSEMTGGNCSTDQLPGYGTEDDASADYPFTVIGISPVGVTGIIYVIVVLGTFCATSRRSENRNMAKIRSGSEEAAETRKESKRSENGGEERETRPRRRTDEGEREGDKEEAAEEEFVEAEEAEAKAAEEEEDARRVAPSPAEVSNNTLAPEYQEMHRSAQDANGGPKSGAVRETFGPDFAAAGRKALGLLHAGATLKVLGQRRDRRGDQETETAQALAQDLKSQFRSEEEAKHAVHLARRMGIRRKQALEEVGERIEKKQALLGAISYIVLTTCYFTILLLQRDVKTMWQTESALREYLTSAETQDGATLMELTNQAEVFDWMEYGFLDKVYPKPEWYNGEPWKANETNYVLQYHRLLGGFALKQQRVQVNASTCVASKRFDTFYPSCWPVLSGASESRDPFGPWYDPKKYRYEDSATGGGFSVGFPIDRKLSLLTLKELKADRFLDKQTRSVTLQVTLYNGMAKFFSIVDLELSFLPTGRIDKAFTMYSFPLEAYLTDVDYFRAFLEVGFALFVMITLGNELTEIVMVKQLRPLRIETSFNTYCTDVWNVLDLLRLGCWSTVIFWYVQILTDPHATSLKLPMADDTASPRLDNVAILWRTYNNVNGVIIILCLFTIFKHMNKSPEHGILIRTIARASGNLLKFLIAFTLVFAYFAVMGVIMFGSALEEFSDVWSSTQVLFMMMTGEYGYEPIWEVDEIAAPVFYYSYLLLVFFLLLNILLAILMDTYASIQEELEGMREKAKRRHPHSILKEIYFDAYRYLANLTERDCLNPPLFISSEDMMVMLDGEQNAAMIAQAKRIKVAEKSFAALEDEFDEVITMDLLRAHYPEEAVVLLLVSVGDRLEEMMSEEGGEEEEVETAVAKCLETLEGVRKAAARARSGGGGGGRRGGVQQQQQQ